MFIKLSLATAAFIQIEMIVLEPVQTGIINVDSLVRQVEPFDHSSSSLLNNMYSFFLLFVLFCFTKAASLWVALWHYT